MAPEGRTRYTGRQGVTTGERRLGPRAVGSGSESRVCRDGRSERVRACLGVQDL